MKKILLFVFLLFCIFISNATLTYAQQDRIKAGYGYLSAPMLVASIISGQYITLLSFNTLDYEDPESGGSFFLEYNHGLSERFSLTGILVYEKFTRRIFARAENEFDKTYTGIDEKDYYTSIMAGFDFKYLTIGDVTVTLGFSFGGCYVKAEAESNIETASESDWLFAFQGDLIKLHYGENLGIDAGIGFGYKGFLTAGISYTF